MIGGVLTFQRAAAALRMGVDIYAGRKLRRIVLAKERRLGVQIAVRGDGNDRPIRGVTLAAIQQHLPELAAAPGEIKDVRSALIDECRGYLKEFDENTARIARSEAESAIGEIVQPQIDELRDGNEAALKLCAELGRRLAQLPAKGTTLDDTAKDRKTVSEND